MRLRPAVDDDHPAYVRLFAELAVPEAPPPRDRFSTAMRDDVLVMEVDGEVAGVVWARARGELWHVVHLMTAPQRRRCGLGHALLDAAAARGRALGFSRWMLTVKPDNVVARALYAAVGMVEVQASAVVRLRWDAVEHLEGAADLVVAVLDDAVDAVPLLGLLPGELRAAQGLPGRVFLGAHRGSTLVGVAGFDPAFPGSPVFRVVDTAVARPLLLALRPHARAGDEDVRVYVEGQEVLRDALVAAGGEIGMRVLRLEGDLPGAPPRTSGRGAAVTLPT